ncbi:unnamed protein product, partial [Symbiodinium pilosum]
ALRWMWQRLSCYIAIAAFVLCVDVGALPLRPDMLDHRKQLSTESLISANATST